MATRAAASPRGDVRDPAAGAAFAEVFARMDAVEAQLGVERQGREAAEARALELSERLASVETQLKHNDSSPVRSGADKDNMYSERRKMQTAKN